MNLINGFIIYVKVVLILSSLFIGFYGTYFFNKKLDKYLYEDVPFRYTFYYYHSIMMVIFPRKYFTNRNVKKAQINALKRVVCDIYLFAGLYVALYRL